MPCVELKKQLYISMLDFLGNQSLTYTTTYKPVTGGSNLYFSRGPGIGPGTSPEKTPGITPGTKTIGGFSKSCTGACTRGVTGGFVGNCNQ